MPRPGKPVKLNIELAYLWRAVDHEGEIRGIGVPEVGVLTAPPLEMPKATRRRVQTSLHIFWAGAILLG